MTDAPPHHDGDGSENTQHDQAFWDHHQRGVEVTDLTGDKVAALMQKNGLTLYAVAPPPFIAPEYAEIVQATHGAATISSLRRIAFPSWYARSAIQSRPNIR